jgi:large subunit ribosomal protein L4
MKLEVKNLTGKSVGSVDLDDSIFGAEIHEHLLWEVVKWQLAKRRGGNASTKRLGEVRGSSKKVWKQKGTGQARQGSRQAVHWVGGGSVKGPRPRSYEYVLPRKAKKTALRAALSLRASEGKIVVLDAFATDGKTKTVASQLVTLNGAAHNKKKAWKALIVDAKTNANLVRGARNLPASQWLAPEGLNVYDILRHETLILTQEALTAIHTALGPKAEANA